MIEAEKDQRRRYLDMTDRERAALALHTIPAPMAPKFGDAPVVPMGRPEFIVTTEGLEKRERELWGQLHDAMLAESYGSVEAWGVIKATSRQPHPLYVEAITDLARARGDMEEVNRLNYLLGD